MTAGGWPPLFCEGGEGQDARSNDLPASPLRYGVIDLIWHLQK